MLQNYLDFYPAQHLKGQLVLWNSNLFFWLKSSDQNILKRFSTGIGLPLALELSSAAAGIGSDPFQIENWTPAVLVRVQNLEYLHRRRGQRGVMRLSCAPGEWVTIYSPQDRGGGSEYNLEYNSIAV